METKNNLEFWNKVEKTNPNHTKVAKVGGRSLTAINAQQQIKNATEQWGMYGSNWGLKDINLSYKQEGLVNDQILAIAQAVFYYPEGEFQIGSSIFVQVWYAGKEYNKIDDDFLKKLETDMTTKSLSKLGFNADVFLGKFDDNKYVSGLRQEFATKVPIKTLPKLEVNSEAWKSLEAFFESGKKSSVVSLKKKFSMTADVEKDLQVIIDTYTVEETKLPNLTKELFDKTILYKTKASVQKVLDGYVMSNDAKTGLLLHLDTLEK